MGCTGLREALLAALAIAATGCKAITGTCHNADAAPVYNYDFSCMGNSLPATAPPQIVVRGVTQEIYINHGIATLQMLPDADLIACRADMTTCDATTNYGTAHSGADGSWEFLPMPQTGGAPLDVHLFVTKFGERTTYLWPNSPLYADNIGTKVPVMQNAFVASLSALGLQQHPEKAILGLMLVDCAKQPIVDSDNVQLSVTVNGMPVTSLAPIDAHIFNEDFNGDFFLMNMPTGTTEVGASWLGKPLRGHTIITYPGTTSETELAPGFLPD